MQKDPDLDLFVLLKERYGIRELIIDDDSHENIEEFSRDDFSEIYLIFDYENHDPLSNLSELKDLIDFFNNETEPGKLYINYPMVESLKDFHNSKNQFSRCLVRKDDNIHYKQAVGEYSEYTHYGSYTVKIWEILMKYTIQKANCLINSSFEIPEYEVYREELDQISIYTKQLDYWKGATTFMLSSIPMFIIDYFGEEFFNDLL